jgi:hypothetical protein
MLDVKTEFLFDMKADFDRRSIINVGTTPHGERRIIYITGGSIEGPKLQAEVLPGGGDWILERFDGVSVLDVRAVARTNDGQIIYTYYRGYLVIEPKVLRRIYKGENVDPSEYYFRATPVFETASEKYSWLNKTMTVGIGQVLPTGVYYRIYAIL